ncbi:MAG: Mrp/NBP35 family ATP-binding protein [Gammaproteobacteria bacterium]|nr:Mrp/NBP35 family ATP-binding protein [Pseudomonadota bacterium]MCH9663562.1 Mrp/NBP35 family ATP-binding protein [Gammaproteobacteria bacterium]
MSAPTRAEISQALHDWPAPFLPRSRDLSEAVSIDIAGDGGLELRVQLAYPARRSAVAIAGQIEQHLRRQCPGLGSVKVTVDWTVRAHAVQRQLTVADNVRNVIAVGSGKGGVGKSTVAVNLALAMAAEGGRVGLLDADVYGPSQPRMLGVHQAPPAGDDKTLVPLQAHGIQVISVGFLVDEEKPVIWRGPMVSAALRQLFDDCAWDDLDYLVIDLPPGTGDIQLTLAQRIPVTGAVIVSTPQDIAVADARKAVRMFEKVGVPVLGLVENMSAFQCPNCQHSTDIFGSDGVDELGRELGIDVLGRIPLNPAIRAHCDGGAPDVVADPDGAAAVAFFGLTQRVLMAAAGRPLDYSRKFGRIQVQPGAAAADEATRPGKPTDAV